MFNHETVRRRPPIPPTHVGSLPCGDKSRSKMAEIRCDSDGSKAATVTRKLRGPDIQVLNANG